MSGAFDHIEKICNVTNLKVVSKTREVSRGVN